MSKIKADLLKLAEEFEKRADTRLETIMGELSETYIPLSSTDWMIECYQRASALRALATSR